MANLHPKRIYTLETWEYDHKTMTGLKSHMKQYFENTQELATAVQNAMCNENVTVIEITKPVQ